MKIVRSNIQILLVLIALLVALRIELPFIVKWYVNRTLDKMPGYHGHVEDVYMKLWRGAYQVTDIKIVKTDGRVPVPFFSATRVEFSVEWKALFQGALVAKMIVNDPTINFVNGKSEATKQVGVDKPWTEIVKQLFPLNFNRVEVLNGSVHYRDLSSKPKVDLMIDKIQMLATNLTNSTKVSKTLVATINLDARAFMEGDLHAGAKLDPFAEKPTFYMQLKMSPVSLTKFSDFVAAYGGFTFQKGTLSVAMELAADKGNINGYVKPLLDNIAVIKLADIVNPLQFTWEGIVAALTRLLRNQPKDRFATEIPITGTIDKPRALILPTLGNLLKNEFIRVYHGNIENTVTLQKSLGGPAPAPATKTTATAPSAKSSAPVATSSATPEPSKASASATPLAPPKR